ncbi:hypothetical protein CPB86DRAFT_842460 [Serendipita vermifera]|nr:hypothetical protein CPB86DRAFT_842460 [Serendipita vermifera]
MASNGDLTRTLVPVTFSDSDVPIATIGTLPFGSDRPRPSRIDFGRAGHLQNSWAVGSSLDLLLQGVILAQTYYYFVHHSATDRKRLRALVISLLVLSCLKSAFGFAAAFNLAAIFQSNLWSWRDKWDWVRATCYLMTVVIGFIVQVWYLRRINIERGRAVLLTGIIGLMNGTLASAVAQTYFEVVGKKEPIKLSAMIHTFLLVCATSAITISLFKSQKLQKLTQGSQIAFYFQSSLIRTAFSITSVAFIQLIMVAATFKNDSEVYILANFCIAKIYIICLLRILNQRPLESTINVELDDLTDHNLIPQTKNEPVNPPAP